MPPFKKKSLLFNSDQYNTRTYTTHTSLHQGFYERVILSLCDYNSQQFTYCPNGSTNYQMGISFGELKTRCTREGPTKQSAQNIKPTQLYIMYTSLLCWPPLQRLQALFYRTVIFLKNSYIMHNVIIHFINNLFFTLLHSKQTKFFKN